MTSTTYKSMTREEMLKKVDEQEERFDKGMNDFLTAPEVCMIDVFFEYRIWNMKLKSVLLVLKDQQDSNLFVEALIYNKALEDGLLDRVEKLTLKASPKSPEHL